MNRAQLDALVEEATVDSNGEDEQVMGLYTMIADNLATPFQSTVLGVEVTVEARLAERHHAERKARSTSSQSTVEDASE